jgi:hypothetical protein
MTDYQQLVEEIRSFLQSTDMTLTDRLKELANAYAEACRTANQRLRRCEEFLGKGLRSEAIQFAQAEPVLLDVVAALDFPERTALQETLTFYGLPDPPKLRMETAEALNQAYAEEQPLTDLLRKHRRLALLRAPLAARIKVMRQIAAADGNSPVWDEDLRAFETARIREIQAELAAGAARQNSTWIAGVAGELERPDWLTRPPASLLRQVQEQARGLAEGKARGVLEEVVGQLNAAMATGDLPRAGELRERYLSLLDKAGLEPNDPIVRHASRPLNWLAQGEQMQSQELEFQNAAAAVEEALDAEADPEEVTRLYQEALALGRDMPEELEQRYDDYLAQKDHARRWRERLILITVAVTGVIVVLGIIAFLWLRSVRSRPSPAGAGPVSAATARNI